MDIRARVLKAFTEALELDGDVDPASLVYRDHPKWTSMAHMTLIAILEADFDTMLETDEVLGMSSFDKAVETMRKYDAAA
jgi:acyl carrier protein